MRRAWQLGGGGLNCSRCALIICGIREREGGRVVRGGVVDAGGNGINIISGNSWVAAAAAAAGKLGWVAGRQLVSLLTLALLIFLSQFFKCFAVVHLLWLDLALKQAQQGSAGLDYAGTVLKKLWVGIINLWEGVKEREREEKSNRKKIRERQLLRKNKTANSGQLNVLIKSTTIYCSYSQIIIIYFHFRCMRYFKFLYSLSLLSMSLFYELFLFWLIYLCFVCF